MSAPPDPVLQPVWLMNHESAMASTNAASAVSAYSGPGVWHSPMPRPASAIQLLPNAQVPYQRKPMTSAAIVATMIATQFTYPSSVEGLHPPTRASVVGLPPNPAEARARAQAPARKDPYARLATSFRVPPGFASTR